MRILILAVFEDIVTPRSRSSARRCCRRLLSLDRVLWLEVHFFAR